MKLIGDAKQNGIYTYPQELIVSLEKLFVSPETAQAHLTITDLLNFIVAFDRVSSVEMVPKIVQTVVESLDSSIKNSDQDMLALFKIFDRMGLLQLE